MKNNNYPFRSGTAEWYAEEAGRLDPICNNCSCKLSRHNCMHTASFTKEDCHKKEHLKRHACPDKNNPHCCVVEVDSHDGKNRGKVRALPKPTGQFGWFSGKKYMCSTVLSKWFGCDNCGHVFENQVYNWWAGHLVCKSCESNLRDGMKLEYDFNVDVLREALRNMHLTKNLDLDHLAYAVESIYGESEYRRMSKDEDIKKWIKSTRAYQTLLEFVERADIDLVDDMRDVWQIVLKGIK